MAYSLGAASRAQLTGVSPRLVAVVDRAIRITSQDFTVHDGLRSLDEQIELKKRGATKTLNSKHLAQGDGFGHAVDLVPWIGGKPRWEWPPIYSIAAAVQFAALELDVRLTWGGVWDRVLTDLPTGAKGLEKAVRDYAARHPGPDFLDGPHFELAK